LGKATRGKEEKRMGRDKRREVEREGMGGNVRGIRKGRGK